MLFIGHWGYNSKHSFCSWSFHQFIFPWGKYRADKESNRCLIEVSRGNRKQTKRITAGWGWLFQAGLGADLSAKVTLNSGLHEVRHGRTRGVWNGRELASAQGSTELEGTSV